MSKITPESTVIREEEKMEQCSDNNEDTNEDERKAYLEMMKQKAKKDDKTAENQDDNEQEGIECENDEEVDSKANPVPQEMTTHKVSEFKIIKMICERVFMKEI
jgi:hypothetical protein